MSRSRSGRVAKPDRDSSVAFGSVTEIPDPEWRCADPERMQSGPSLRESRSRAGGRESCCFWRKKVEKAVDPFLGSYSFSVPFDTGSRKAWVSAGAESDVLSVCLLVKEARCSGEGEVPGEVIRLFFLFWTIEEDRKCRLEGKTSEAVLESLRTRERVPRVFSSAMSADAVTCEACFREG